MPRRGAIVGYALATIHRAGVEDRRLSSSARHKVGLVFPKAGNGPSRATTTYTVVGYFKSGMSEYDSTHVYVPLERLQEMRLLVRPAKAAGRSIRSRSR